MACHLHQSLIRFRLALGRSLLQLSSWANKITDVKTKWKTLIRVSFRNSSATDIIVEWITSRTQRWIMNWGQQTTTMALTTSGVLNIQFHCAEVVWLAKELNAKRRFKCVEFVGVLTSSAFIVNSIWFFFVNYRLVPLLLRSLSVHSADNFKCPPSLESKFNCSHYLRFDRWVRSAEFFNWKVAKAKQTKR